jgi:hypothetical protein
LREFSTFFGLVRFVSAQQVASPLFPLPGAASPPADVTKLPHHITIPSHGAKMSSLASLLLGMQAGGTTPKAPITTPCINLCPNLVDATFGIIKHDELLTY